MEYNEHSEFYYLEAEKEHLAKEILKTQYDHRNYRIINNQITKKPFGFGKLFRNFGNISRGNFPIGNLR